MRKTRLSWIQRWCVCSDNSLYISKSPKDHLSVTKVYLPHYSICRSKVEEHKREWVFKIWAEGKKTIVLAAQTKDSREQWVQGLREAARNHERTPVNTLTKSTIRQITSSLSSLRASLGRDQRLASVDPPVSERPRLHSQSTVSDDVWMEVPQETVVLSGTLKKRGVRAAWESRHYVVIGPILREYVSGTDEWPLTSLYLPGSTISSETGGNPAYLVKITPPGKEPILLAAKSMIEMNVWEQELAALSRLPADPAIIRDMEPDYVDLDNGPSTSTTHDKSRSLQHGNSGLKTPTPGKRVKFQRGHRRTRSDNYFNPNELVPLHRGRAESDGIPPPPNRPVPSLPWHPTPPPRAANPWTLPPNLAPNMAPTLPPNLAPIKPRRPAGGAADYSHYMSPPASPTMRGMGTSPTGGRGLGSSPTSGRGMGTSPTSGRGLGSSPPGRGIIRNVPSPPARGVTTAPSPPARGLSSPPLRGPGPRSPLRTPTQGGGGDKRKNRGTFIYDPGEPYSCYAQRLEGSSPTMFHSADALSFLNRRANTPPGVQLRDREVRECGLICV
eukprot:sb/3463570/